MGFAAQIKPKTEPAKDHVAEILNADYEVVSKSKDTPNAWTHHTIHLNKELQNSPEFKKFIKSQIKKIGRTHFKDSDIVAAKLVEIIEPKIKGQTTTPPYEPNVHITESTFYTQIARKMVDMIEAASKVQNRQATHRG